VVAPREVRALDQFLIEGLPDEPSRSVLTGLSPEPLTAAVAGKLWSDAEVHFFHHDAFFTRRAKATLERNGLPGVTVDLLPDIPAGPFDLALFGFPHDAELQLTKDILERVHRALLQNGVLLASTDNPKDSRLAQELQRVFGGVKMAERTGKGRLYLARRKRAETEVRGYHCLIDVSLKGRDFQFRTRPGVFSHAKFDDGARTLVELAQFGPEDALLDIGCGYGAVGIVLASQMPGGRVTMVDSSARAVALAQENILLNGVTNASVVLSDTVSLPDGPSSFDRILANPPYFSNYRISELFVRQAVKFLKDGGTVQLVTQSPDPHLALFSRILGNSDVQKKRGYSVITGRSSAKS
jgi:16S rRNA (guanine1207-N2)-methyltransferase